MGKPRIDWVKDAQYALRSEPGVKADIEARTKRVHKAVGGDEAGYGMSTTQGARKPQGRWRGAVFTKTAKAKRDNARNNTLIKGLDSGRG